MVSAQKEQTVRPMSEEVRQAQQKLSEKHQKVKQDAVRLWELIDNPVYDAALDPEREFSAEAIAVAKRGRRSTMESALVGSIGQSAVRDFERSAKRHGADEEVKRLSEYPEALERYEKIMKAMQCSNRNVRQRRTGR